MKVVTTSTKKRSAKLLFSQLKRNNAAEMKFILDTHGKSATEIKKEKAIMDNQERLLKDFREVMGYPEVSDEDHTDGPVRDSATDKLYDLGITDQDIILGLYFLGFAV